MGNIALELVLGGRIMEKTGEDSRDCAEGLDEIQTFFCNFKFIYKNR